MMLKPIKKHDSQEQIRSDIAHDVRVGGKAKVSLGGMSTAVVEVIGIGRDGISTRDSKGRTYNFIWEHVHGPAGADAKVDDAKEVAAPHDNEPMTKSVLGVFGQPNRIAPPVRDELLCAIHEAAHAVFSQILDNQNDKGRAAMWQEAGGWGGEVGRNTPADGTPSALPQLDATQPFYWQQYCRKAWNYLLCSSAGTVAELIHEGELLDADGIRYHPFGSIDRNNSATIGSHFWPDKHREAILDLAAETAAQLCQRPAVWAAITDLAKFLTDDGRHKASIFETSVIVRQHLPQNIPSPHADLAVSLARTHTAFKE